MGPRKVADVTMKPEERIGKVCSGVSVEKDPKGGVKKRGGGKNIC